MMIAGEMILVEVGVSRYGLRRAHALRAGQAVDQEELLTRLGIDEGLLLGRLEYEELGMWHLRVYWRDVAVEEPVEQDGQDN